MHIDEPVPTGVADLHTPVASGIHIAPDTVPEEPLEPLRDDRAFLVHLRTTETRAHNVLRRLGFATALALQVNVCNDHRQQQAGLVLHSPAFKDKMIRHYLRETVELARRPHMPIGVVYLDYEPGFHRPLINEQWEPSDKDDLEFCHARFPYHPEELELLSTLALWTRLELLKYEIGEQTPIGVFGLAPPAEGYPAYPDHIEQARQMGHINELLDLANCGAHILDLSIKGGTSAPGEYARCTQAINSTSQFSLRRMIPAFHTMHRSQPLNPAFVSAWGQAMADNEVSEMLWWYDSTNPQHWEALQETAEALARGMGL